ncbi:MAG: GHKL domain-containing protein [Crocinitomicaceae bacterium]|nr:GHKL domain-containing protein [Crocinitomicaceae bacterium]
MTEKSVKKKSGQFTENELDHLQQYLEFITKYDKEVNTNIRKKLIDDPLWGPIISQQSDEEAEQQANQSFEIQKRAILEGEWEPYVNNLVQQGKIYAKLGVEITDWMEIVKIYKRMLVPYIRADYQNDADKAVNILNGMSLLTDYAMEVLTQSYFDEKNAVINEMNRSLETKVEERTAQLQEINEELESFTYTVSHDLRAPLRAVDGFAKVLRNKCSDQLTKDAMNYLNIISESVAKMSDLIDDLLAFSRVGRNEAKRASFDLGKLFQETFDDIKLEPDDDNVNLIIHDISKVTGDKDLLKHVTRNLLDNALKFTRGRENRKIEVGKISKNKKSTFYIKDNGVGFDSRYADKLFGMFERLHSDAEFEGTGVGLAIVQRVIHKHGGSVWAESELGQGSVFYFTLT